MIIINETLAKNLWPGEDPIGKIVRADNPERTVVGVVGDVHHMALEEESGNEFYIPMRQTQDYGTVDMVVRTSLPTAELASRAARGAAADRAEFADGEYANASNDGGSRRVAAAICREVARRIRGICAGAGVAGNLCGDFVFGEPAHAGDWDSHGAGRVGGDAAEKYFVADAGARGNWNGGGNGGVVGAGADFERAFVWSDVQRSSYVCRDAGDADRSGGACWIFARATRFADRSHGSPTDELSYFRDK